MAVSDRVKSGPEKAPHRSLWESAGSDRRGAEAPAYRRSQRKVRVRTRTQPPEQHRAQAVKDGIRLAGGVPVEFPAIGVCDGIAMGHVGMKYSLASAS